MAYRPQTAFSAGELDPALWERTDFEKYRSGLATLRNCLIGKTGRIISRGGQMKYLPCKTSTTKSILYSPPFSIYVLEWGHLYVRIHTPSLGTYIDINQPFLESDLSNIQFIQNGLFTYVQCAGKTQLKMTTATGVFVNSVPTGNYNNCPMFGTYNDSTIAADVIAVGTPSGYNVEYVVTLVGQDGEESNPFPFIVSGTIGALNSNLPIAVGQSNLIEVEVTSGIQAIAVNVYRRPKASGAFGFIGSTPTGVLIAGVYVYDFVDIGQNADFTHSPPVLNMTTGTFPNFSPVYACPRTAIVYQQRLILTNSQNLEQLDASRTGYQNNFYRDYPLSNDSALTFKCGTSGNAAVLRLWDNGGLLAFTTVGIYWNNGALTPDNLAFEKKGNWVINEKVPPLDVPGALLFNDKATNTVRTLIYSNEYQGYPGEEISIFSNHLFLNKKVVSWAFQDGDIPVVWVVFDDGSLAALTYQQEHQMQAWSRHDSSGALYESVTVLKSLDDISIAYFIVNRNGTRYIESSPMRTLKDIKDFVGMDAAVTFKNDLTATGSVLTIDALDRTNWGGQLSITSSLPIFANIAGKGAPGDVFRFFDSQGSAVDLTVVSITSPSFITVQPSVDFPAEQGSGAKIYSTYSALTGLDHLNNQLVSILSDGYVVASPNNDIDQPPAMLVQNGSLTLPNGMLGAIIHVGIPYTCDVQTLPIDTVEQKPALLESKIVHKVYVKVYNSRGLYVGSVFAPNDTVGQMEDCESRYENIQTGNIGNSAQAPYTKRIDLPIPNDWKSNGQICLRQVDPLPMEILSIIPDLSVL